MHHDTLSGSRHKRLPVLTLLTLLLGAATFAFWMWLYPQDLSYQEQNQLFLFTWDYLLERLALPGGLADWISEFLVQFFYWRWAGALIMAMLAMLLQRAVWRMGQTHYLVSFIPSLLLLVYMGDVEVLLSYPVALLIAVWLCPLFLHARWHRLWLIPLGWWLIGPMILLPVLLSMVAMSSNNAKPLVYGDKAQQRVISRSASIFSASGTRNQSSGASHGYTELLILIWTAIVFFVGTRLMANQYPLRDALFGLNYYRLVETLPALQWIIPIVTLLSIIACNIPLQFRHPALAGALLTLLLVLGTFFGVRATYDRDTHETLAYDWLIRHERYVDVIKRAEKYQPRNPVSACSVNFCLFTQGQLENRLTDFYQCGTRGLVLPSIRDNLSDITSAELLWMMGMPNITLQYAFDLQESIQNGRKSGRFMQRIAACNIVNGWYERATRYLDLLEHSLFYRKWAREQKEMIQDEARVAADPVYAWIRSVRFQDDFITNYNTLDLMMAILYNQNKNNFMAAQYFEAWQRLKQMEDKQ